MVETVEASGTKEKEIGKKTDLPRSDMQGSILSRLRNIELILRNNPLLAHELGVDGSNKTITLASGEDYCSSLWTDGAFLYVGLYTSPAKIVKIDLSDFTKVSTLTLDGGEDYCYFLVSDGTYLYAGLDTLPAKVVKINLKTFTKASTLTFDTGENSVYTMTTDGTYLYVGLQTIPAKIVKVELSSFTKISTLTFPLTDYQRCTSLLVVGNYLYAGEDGHPPAQLFKIDLSTFTIDTILELPIENSHFTYMQSDGLYLFVSIATGTTTTVIKVDLTTFERCDSLFTETKGCFGILLTGTHLYATLDQTNPAEIVVANKNDLSDYSKIFLSTGQRNPVPLATDGTYLYIGLQDEPTTIVRHYITPRVESSLNQKLKTLGGHKDNIVVYTRPDRGSKVTLTAGVGWAYGSYVEVVAADDITIPFKIVGIEIMDMVADKEYQIGIGTGAAASEVLKQEIPVKSNVATDSKTIMFDLNTVPEISQSKRVAIKCACETDSLGCGVKLIIVTKY